MDVQPSQTTNVIPYLLSIEQVAERLGVNVRHVRRLVFERRISYVKWGHLLRFDPASVDRFIEANKHEPRSSRPAQTNPGGSDVNQPRRTQCKGPQASG